MATWAGVALALRGPDEDALRSRVPTYIHPLAGRALAWHGLSVLAGLEPAPAALYLVTSVPLEPTVLQGLPATFVEAPPEAWWPALAERLGPGVDRLLIVDAAAAALGPTLASLVRDPGERAIVGRDGVLAVWIARTTAAERAARGATLSDWAVGLEAVPPQTPAEDCIVRDRGALARAGAVVRDRLVARLMEDGVTFLLPSSVLVDVDVRIGPDAVIYPGVVLEGNTTVGAETVIGPGCRIIDSRIGSGVELKGWNYISGTHIRNRAVLEPYVRRGFD